MNQAPPQADEPVDERIRAAYEGGEIYKAESVSLSPNAGARDYGERLLGAKIETVRKHLQEGLVVDLCCGNGKHVFALANSDNDFAGVDFSRPFIERAREDAKKRGLGHLRFEVADARDLPFSKGEVGTLYSLSSLYAIPQLDLVLAEIGRVLRPGGRCILDLANSRSLNAICVKAYTDLPPTFHVTLVEMDRLCAKHGLKIIEHRRFQLLPLWADKPTWLWPLLHPGWKAIMARRIRGKMLDEWISSAPLLRRFAFRHLLVCKKVQTNGTQTEAS